MKGTKENLIANVLKARLILSDYTLVADEEKDVTLELLGGYIYDMEDKKAIYLYSKICDSNLEEKDIYIEILMDYLNEREVYIQDKNCA